jgi:hypothetical protein
LRVTVLLNLFFVGSEVFTEFYSGGSHTASASYLFLGLHGHNALVPWIWTALAFNSVAAVILLSARAKEQLWLADIACALTFVGVWIEKGMGLIIPGFVPSTLHELVEYMPNELEWRVVVGIWAAGLIVFTLGIKIAVEIFAGRMRHQLPDQEPDEPQACRRRVMPIVSAVLTLSQTPTLRVATLTALRSTPAVTLGEAHGDRVPVVLDTPDRAQDKAAWDALESLPGVTFIELVFADFSDLSPHQDADVGAVESTP